MYEIIICDDGWDYDGSFDSNDDIIRKLANTEYLCRSVLINNALDSSVTSNNNDHPCYNMSVVNPKENNSSTKYRIYNKLKKSNNIGTNNVIKALKNNTKKKKK